MAILALGISHRRATVGLLERLAFADEDLVKAYRRTGDDAAIDEAVIVSTCNRVEIYGSVPSYHAGFQALKRVLCESRGVAPEDLAEPLYSHYESDAAEHLFTVASGLDSMVLGEPQILSQVRDALRRADGEGASGPSLVATFNAAVNTGRRVRSETGVGAAPDVFVAAGAELGAEALGGLEGRHAVVIGAGHMSALAAKHLRQRGVATVRVLNRSLERARALAERTLAASPASPSSTSTASARRSRFGPPRPRPTSSARTRSSWTRSGGSRSADAPNVSARSSARSANAATRPSTPSSNASAPSSHTSSPRSARP
jgi:glutamyl-tRNA reductase